MPRELGRGLVQKRLPEMRMLALTLCTSVLSALVISNAYVEKKQFYPTVVYILSSNRSLGVIYLQAFVMVWFLCKFLKVIFFGTLRAAEVEHLIESSWYAILETFILLAAFHQELSVSFVTMVTILFVTKSFHWLAQDRVDYMERSPVITWLFHLRAISLFTLLLLVDYLFVRHSWATLYHKGPSVDIVFGLEYAIMFLSALSSALHYVLHTIDRQSEDPWENKTIYIRIVNIIIGFFELALYVSYMAFMLYVLFIPLHIARRVYVTAKNFQKSIYDVIASQQAIRHLNTLYPDATVEELEAVNNVCIICREEMVSRCKKLPCSHIFHTACLQSWFQRQQTCPTCRMDVLNRAVVNRLTQAQPQQQQQQARQAPPPQQAPFNPQQNNGFIPPMMFPPPMMPPMWPHPPQPQVAPRQQQQQQQQQNTGEATPSQPGNANARSDGQEEATASPEAGTSPPPPPPTQGSVPASNSSQPPPPFQGFPAPFPFPPPPFMPPGFGTGPITGDGLQALSAEQLQQLEGMERANVEARIAVLRDVQRLLDSAVLRLNQYSTVMAVISPPAGPGFPGYPYPPFSQPQASGAAEDTSSTSPNPNPGPSPGPSTDPSADPSVGPSPPPPPPPQAGQPAQESAGKLFQLPRDSDDHNPDEATPPAVSVTSADPPDELVSGGVATGGVVSSPGAHVDSEIRQRRLERLHSMPTTLQQSLSPLAEERVLPADNKSKEGEEGEGGSTEV